MNFFPEALPYLNRTFSSSPSHPLPLYAALDPLLPPLTKTHPIALSSSPLGFSLRSARTPHQACACPTVVETLGAAAAEALGASAAEALGASAEEALGALATASLGGAMESWVVAAAMTAIYGWVMAAAAAMMVAEGWVLGFLAVGEA